MFLSTEKQLISCQYLRKETEAPQKITDQSVLRVNCLKLWNQFSEMKLSDTPTNTIWSETLSMALDEVDPVLTNLLEFFDRVTEEVKEKNNVDVIFLDLAKAFDKIPHMRLLAKLRAHGIV